MSQQHFILTFIVSLVFTWPFTSAGQKTTDNAVQIDKYKNTQEQTIHIEVPFARSLTKAKIRSIQKELVKLNGQEIFHVDLVYTAFRKAPDFDQQKLNEDRMARLRQWIPAVANANPDWTAYEQTGAKDRNTAKSYFHGFVIHYGAPIDRNHFSFHVNGIEKPYSTITIDNKNGASIKNAAGTYINIPVNAVRNQDNELVRGSYQIHYIEYRNAAEMALSGIPMFYNEGGVDEIFNSVGMFEIRATQNDENLILDKEIEISFQTTEILPNVSFFKMDDATGEWTEEHAIEFDENKTKTKLVTGLGKMSQNYSVTRESSVQSGHEIKVGNHRPPEAAIDQGGFQGYSFIRKGMVIDKDEVYCLLNRKSFEAFEDLVVSADSISKMALSIDKDIRGILIPRLKAKAFVEAIIGVPLSELEIERDGQETIYSLACPDVVVEPLNLVGDEPIPHTPGLVQGLKVKGFGVYNCDQTLRIEEPIALQPTYYDKEDGSVLEGLYVACVIDIGLNASLTYHPNHLVCNKKGNSKALIFTNDEEIYLVQTSAFKKEPLKDGPIDLEVKNITNQIKSPSDLQNVLGV